MSETTCLCRSTNEAKARSVKCSNGPVLEVAASNEHEDCGMWTILSGTVLTTQRFGGHPIKATHLGMVALSGNEERRTACKGATYMVEHLNNRIGSLQAVQTTVGGNRSSLSRLVWNRQVRVVRVPMTSET